jgi:two-component sensor histidine kinase
MYGTASLFLVAILFTRSLTLWQGYRDALSRAEDATRDVAALVEQNLQRTFGMSDLIVDQTLAIVDRTGGFNTLKGNFDAYRQLSALNSKIPTGGNVWIVDVQGQPLLMSDRFPRAPIDLSDREWFKAHTDRNQDSYVGEAIMGQVNREPLFTFSRSIRDAEGRLHAIVVVSLRPVFFASTLFAPEYRHGGALGIYGLDGSIIARSPFEPAMLGQKITSSASFENSLSMEQNTYYGTSVIDRRDRIVSLRRVHDWPIMVAASITVADALAGWYSQITWSVAFVLGIVAALTWLVWLGLGLIESEASTRASLARAVSERDLLFQELHHRIKNNLATIGSLLALQSRQIASPEAKIALLDTRERIASISLIHETLYRTGSASEVDLAEYLSQLVRGLADTYGADDRGVALRTEMTPCTIDLQRAIPIALTVNEAIANAFKHAFDEGQEGEIKVTLDCAGDRFLIEVRDSGKGMQGPPRAQSLGMRLIGSFVAQLQGEFRFRTDGGTVFSLSVPKKVAAC